MTKHIVQTEVMPEDDCQFLMVYNHEGVPWALTVKRENGELLIYDPAAGWLAIKDSDLDYPGALYILHIYELTDAGEGYHVH